MGGAGCLGNCKYRRPPYQEAERDLTSGGLMRLRHLLEYAASHGPRPREIIMTEGAVSDHSDAMLFAPGDHGVLDRTLLQVVEDLVSGKMPVPGNPSDRVEFTHVEVTDAPRQDFPVALELLEGANGVLQGVLPGPVQKVTIQPIGLQAG